MMTAQERAKLRSLSNSLRDLVYLGKDGLTPNVIAQVNDNLYAHELIKIKVQKTANYYIGLAENAVSLLNETKNINNESIGIKMNPLNYSKSNVNNPLTSCSTSVN